MVSGITQELIVKKNLNWLYISKGESKLVLIYSRHSLSWHSRVFFLKQMNVHTCKLLKMRQTRVAQSTF